MGSDFRRYDLDWLRVQIIGLLIPFHTATMIDDGGDFYVKNAVSSRFLAEAANVIGVSGMPLLLFVAGAAGWFALRKNGWQRLLRERASRQLLPFLVIGHHPGAVRVRRAPLESGSAPLRPQAQTHEKSRLGIG